MQKINVDNLKSGDLILIKPKEANFHYTEDDLIYLLLTKEISTNDHRMLGTLTCKMIDYKLNIHYFELNNYKTGFYKINED